MQHDAHRCPMCDTMMTGEPEPTDAGNPAVVRGQIESLERRVDDISNGVVTPRQVKDEMLWMCPICQRIAGDVSGRDSGELEQRIRDDIQRLDHRLGQLHRRAS
jgi:hypothetical protein